MIENDYITFKQPKLFFIKKTQNLNNYNQLNIDFQQKEKQLQKKIENLNNLHKENEEEELQNQISQNPENFFQNPIKYMDYLAKKYCTENANILENLKIKQEMTNNFHKLCNQIEGHIKIFTANEERRLNDLKKDVDKKLKGESIPIEESKIQNMNNLNNNNNINGNLKSSPMTMDDQEFLSRVIGYQGTNGGSALDGIITNGNAINFVNNNKKSYLNEDNLYINALSCLKGDNLIAPKNNFIAVKELSLNDIDQNKIQDTKNMTDLKTKMQIEQYNNQIIGKDNKKIKNKINNIRKTEKKNLEDLISYSNNHINNMKQYQKEKTELIKKLKYKLNKEFDANAIKFAMNKISISNQNLDKIIEMKNYYNNNNENNIKIPKKSFIDWKKRKEICEKDFNETQQMVNNFLKGRGATLNKPVKKGNKNTKKKKRNNSAIPYNNKKYNNYKKY